MLFRHLQGKQPRHIAKELGVTVTFINNALGALRIKGRQVLKLDSEEVKERRRVVRQELAERRRELSEAILAFLEEHGPHHITLSELYVHLQQVLPPTVRAPGMSTIYYLLRKDFKLRFRATPPALTRYLDPAYDEKRQWVARLLAHFMQQGMVIVSVDESNIRADSFAKRQWRFVPPRVSSSDLLHGPLQHHLHLEQTEVPVYKLPAPLQEVSQDRAAEVEARHAGRRKRGRPRSVNSASNRSDSQRSREQQSSSVPASTLAPTTAAAPLREMMSSLVGRFLGQRTAFNSVPTLPLRRVDTEGPLLRDTDDVEEVKLPAEETRQVPRDLQQETHPVQAEKRGRGRPAFRPLDLPSSKPLRKASMSSGD